jgi:putative membrane protein
MSTHVSDRTPMRHGDAAAVIGLIAFVALWMGLTDGMLRYLRPSMRPWLVGSGAALALLAAGIGFVAWRETRGERDQDEEIGGRATRGHHHRLGLVGWLLVVPFLAVWCVDPSALGAYAAQRQAAFGMPIIDFDLPSYVEAHSFSGQTVELKLHEFVFSANSDDDAVRSLLADTPVRLRGFVVPSPDGKGFLLVRFLIGCCAGDAIGLEVDVRGYHGPALEEETWVEVTGTYDAQASDAQPRDRFTSESVPVLAAHSVRQIDEPDSPYEYPR